MIGPVKVYQNNVIRNMFQLLVFLFISGNLLFGDVISLESTPQPLPLPHSGVCVQSPECQAQHTPTGSRMRLEEDILRLTTINPQLSAVWKKQNKLKKNNNLELNNKVTRGQKKWKYPVSVTSLSSFQIYQEPKNDGECLSNIKEFLKGCTAFRVEVSSFLPLFSSGLAWCLAFVGPSFCMRDAELRFLKRYNRQCVRGVAGTELLTRASREQSASARFGDFPLAVRLDSYRCGPAGTVERNWIKLR